MLGWMGVGVAMPLSLVVVGLVGVWPTMETQA